MSPIVSDHDFLCRAMRSYDNPSCITTDEFNRDLYTLVTIKKTLKKYHAGADVNVRRMVNYFVLVYNCFGKEATNLILYKIKEPELLGIVLPIVAFLGYEVIGHISCDLNTSIIQELLQL